MEGEDRCRFYRAEWPEEGEVVVARVSSVGASGSYVTLHEYGDKEAMLPHSELSNRRLRSVHGHVRLAQLLCVRVTRVDQSKGYIDVSKRQVEEEKDKQACEERYVRGRLVQGVIRRVGELMGMTSLQQLEDLNQRTAWRLDTLHDKQTASCDVFQQAYSNPDVLNDLDLDTQTLTFLLQVISHRFCPRNIKIRSDVEVMCWSREGVDAVKEALKAGQNSASAHLPVHVSVVAPPVYMVTCVTRTNQQAAALEAVEQAVAAIGNSIKRFSGGKFRIRDQAGLVRETLWSDAGTNQPAPAYSSATEDSATSGAQKTTGICSSCLFN